MRHAKSSWSDPSLADFDRPLNERGSRTAPLIGAVMAERKLSPQLILTSPALRAKTTAEIVSESSGLKAELKFDERIYEASPRSLSQVVAELPDDIESAMIVGHNPGIEGFIRYLTGRLEPMPTAALAIIDLNISRWSETNDGCGELREIVRPKELTSL